MNALLYIHGKGGSVMESEHYKLLFPNCEVIGLDYQTFTPWDTFIGMITIGQSYFNPVAWMIACIALFDAIQEGHFIRSKSRTPYVLCAKSAAIPASRLSPPSNEAVPSCIHNYRRRTNKNVTRP